MELGILEFTGSVDNFKKGSVHTYIASVGNVWVLPSVRDRLFQELKVLCSANRYKSPELFLDRSIYSYKKLSSVARNYATLSKKFEF
jgi:hypothetical protein